MPNRHNRRAFVLSRSAYVSPGERKRRQDRQGIALLAGCGLVLAAMLGGAFVHDSRLESIARQRAEAARLEAERPKAWQPARIEGVNGSAPIMAAIAGELRKAGCQVRVDSPSSYEVESC